MREIHIKSPIWKSRSVGIADYKITDDILVYIDYVGRSGVKLFPGMYFMEKEKAQRYPVQVVKNVELRIIPIKDFEFLEEEV